MDELRILGIIPARYGSTRFPGKPLAVINGRTMIQRVYEQAQKCDRLAAVVVATDDQSIFNHVSQFGGQVVMTGSHHASGTERCREAMHRVPGDPESFDGVINIQGDEPYIRPGQIGQVAECLCQPGTSLATLIQRITSPGDLSNPNVVKVVTDHEGYALCFSRSAIPFTRGATMEEWLTATEYYKHIGLYGYRRSALETITELPAAPMELAESLEQLRWLWHGFRIRTQITEYESIAIDTPADLLKITNTNGGR